MTAPIVRLEDVSDEATLTGWLAWMNQMGPRHTGTDAHDAFVRWIRRELEEMGLPVDVDTQTFEAWDARRWSLSLVDGEENEQPLPVASYFAYSGSTPPDGVVGDLVDVGTGSEAEVAAADLTGRIAVVHQDVRTGFMQLLEHARAAGLPVNTEAARDWDSFVRHCVGNGESTSDPAAYDRLGFGIHMTPDLGRLRDAGATAAVVVWEGASPDGLRGQFAPILRPLAGLPAVFVDGSVGAHLAERMAEGGARARLVLEAWEGKRPTDQLVVDLPGTTADDEVVLVVTHTDGPNAVDENGPLALLALLRLLARRMSGTRARRFVFAFTTGHCTPGALSLARLFELRPELVEQVTCVLCIEHLGATEWVDTPEGLEATGRMEPAFCSTSDDVLAALATTVFEAHQVDNVWITGLFGECFMLGEGSYASLLGLPGIGYLPAPTYLLTMSDSGEIERVDVRRMRQEIAALADLLLRLDTAPRLPRRAPLSFPG